MVLTIVLPIMVILLEFVQYVTLFQTPYAEQKLYISLFSSYIVILK